MSDRRAFTVARSVTRKVKVRERAPRPSSPSLRVRVFQPTDFTMIISIDHSADHPRHICRFLRLPSRARARAAARRERAATIVSFALIAPIFLFIIFGALEFGRVLMTWIVITNEVAEAARYGAVRYDAARDSAE